MTNPETQIIIHTQKMVLTADYYLNQNLLVAIAQGGICGVVGLPGLIANIPALYTIVFRCIQQIALCYNYSTQIFILL